MIHCDKTLTIQLSRLLSDPKNEKVAAILGKRVGDDYYVTGVIPAQNEDNDPTNMFFISNRQIGQLMSEAERRGCLLLGIAHSHLANHPAEPSVADIHGCVHSVNAVYHTASRSLTWFNRSGALNSQVEAPPPTPNHAWNRWVPAYSIAD
jgi:proteasome lid subunit RPN8/RPN11